MFSLSHQSEKQKIYTITIIGSIANFLLVLLKFVAGFIGNSAAMIADAVHSLSDFVTDVIVIVFVRFAHKPKDELYAYGYGKYETLATAIIGVLLFIVGSGILWDGGWKIYHYFADGTLPEPHIIAFYMALVSIAVKELLYRYTAAVGRAVKSQVVVANAWHHRSDAMSSIGTAVGIGGAIFFGDGFEILDPVAAIVVSFFIMKVAIQLIIPSLGELLEKSLPEEVQEQIRQIILSYPGVSEPHHLRTRRIVYSYFFFFYLCMDGDMPLRIAHDHVSAIERKIRAAFGMQTHISILLEPVKKPKSS